LTLRGCERIGFVKSRIQLPRGNATLGEVSNQYFAFLNPIALSSLTFRSPESFRLACS